MPCHRLGDRTLSHPFKCMLVQPAANRCQAHCQHNTKSGALVVGRACGRPGAGHLSRQLWFSLGQKQHLAGKRSFADSAASLQQVCMSGCAPGSVQGFSLRLAEVKQGDDWPGQCCNLWQWPVYTEVVAACR